MRHVEIRRYLESGRYGFVRRFLSFARKTRRVICFGIRSIELLCRSTVQVVNKLSTYSTTESYFLLHARRLVDCFKSKYVLLLNTVTLALCASEFHTVHYCSDVVQRYAFY